MKKHLQSVFIPILAAVYPVVFLYNTNVEIITLGSLVKPLAAALALALLLYAAFFFMLKRQPARAAIAALVFIIFFYLYSAVYERLLQMDIITVKHYTLLPLLIVAAVYAGYFISGLARHKYTAAIQQGMLVVIGGLLAFNLVGIIPAEIKKAEANRQDTSTRPEISTNGSRQYPDIYFFIFDEFAGFNSMRDYWHYSEIDDFVTFLEERGFFVADRATSHTVDTLVEVASRMNFEQYETGESADFYFEKISHNRLFQFLKGKGYTTVVFDETRASFAYPSKTPVSADYSFEYDPKTMDDQGMVIDDFAIMLLDMTMLRPVTGGLKQNNAMVTNHRNMVLFSLNQVTKLSDVPSPKVVYVHLMLPHMPFIFDANGSLTDVKYHQNWNYYLGNYIYATRLIEQTVTDLQANADPARPPVIILESDHGARNKKTGHPDSVNFSDYPDEDKYDLMFAVNIPGYDYARLPATIDPINTFPYILNNYFDAGLPLK